VRYRTPIRPRVIAFLIDSPVDLLNLIGLMSVFSYPKIGDKPAYLTKILSADSEHEIRDEDRIALINSIPFPEYAGTIDTLVVIGGESSVSELSPDLIRWVRRNSDRFRRIASVGFGTLKLASTGLLDGKRVTTHWQYVERLAKQYPQLLIEKNPIFVKDGNIYSTAGATAGIDMALSFVEDDLGYNAAMAIARDLVLYIRRSGNDTQYSNLLAQQADAGGTRMRDLPAWTRARLTETLDVSTLAKAVAMSPRTFARQFEFCFGTTPARWVQSLRVEAVCAHLDAQELPLKAIARITGFRDEQALRRAFTQQHSMTPREYRERSRSLSDGDVRWRNEVVGFETCLQSTGSPDARPVTLN
jgi:transcriptional regulator GlxA family with amidase domain